jgi:hypothetical protein
MPASHHVWTLKIDGHTAKYELVQDGHGVSTEQVVREPSVCSWMRSWVAIQGEESPDILAIWRT